MGESVVLKPGSTSLTTLEGLYWDSPAAVLDAACRPAVERAAAVIGQAAAGEAAVYGVNTGFGKLASERIPTADTAALQRNLILSHCCGVGALADPKIVRLTMTLKLLSLGRGASGVRWELIELLQQKSDFIWSQFVTTSLPSSFKRFFSVVQYVFAFL